MRKQLKSRLFLLLSLLLLTSFLTGCRNAEDFATIEVTPLGTVTVEANATPAALPSPKPVPDALAVKTTLHPAIDPACLENKGAFALVTASLPKKGLEPGMVQVFCATGAPADAPVRFTLRSPSGQEQSYDVMSVDQGGVTAAIQPITIGADAEPGKWTLTASYQNQTSSLSFKVLPPSHPFLVLSEPVADDAKQIRVAIGGLTPNAQAIFAIYKLIPGTVNDGASEAQGELLLDNIIQADAEGRADVVLDIADQPGGPYLLVLLPSDSSLATNPVVQLPDQQNMALAVNIHRSGEKVSQGGAPGTAMEDYLPANLPAAPRLVEASANLPDSVSVNLPDATLPECTSTDAPTIRLWPGSGEIGEWWFGCASGFDANTPLKVDARLGDGKLITFNLTATSSEGVKVFRWYSAPKEGSGVFSLSLSDPGGHKAKIDWQIASASRPHVLTFPHTVVKGVGSDLYLTGFPANAEVKLGIYRLAKEGAAQRVAQLKVQADSNGMLQKDFAEANQLQPGSYMLLAEGLPTYRFADIDTTASAVEFFSVGGELDPKSEFYTLFLGRKPGVLVAVGEKPASEIAEATSSPSEETPATATATSVPPTATPATVATTANGIPKVFTLAADNSGRPVCPAKTAKERAICIVPTTVEQGTYVLMIMQGFKSGTSFHISVKTPKGGVARFNRKANKSGFAEAHWYPLNNESLGNYRVSIVGGGKKFSKTFKVIKAQSPHVVVQSRSVKPGTPVIISVTGLAPSTNYILARYQGKEKKEGDIAFKLISETAIKTDKRGGARKQFGTKAKDKGILFLTMIFKPGDSTPLAKEVYSPGKSLYLRYPFAWGQYKP
ncbi:MAG: hypothetical protein DSY55_02005 [Clostridia bacterium]|nr:MAG: hypothetical protein DSY55_02005 [Clostridia bacterium]